MPCVVLNTRRWRYQSGTFICEGNMKQLYDIVRLSRCLAYTKLILSYNRMSVRLFFKPMTPIEISTLARRPVASALCHARGLNTLYSHLLFRNIVTSVKGGCAPRFHDPLSVRHYMYM